MIRTATLGLSTTALLVAGGLAVPGAFASPPTANNLDVSFGGDGKVVTDFAGQSDGGNAVAVQADGKIVVAGQTLVLRPDTGVPSLEPFDQNFAVVRYNRDGSLDTSFGGDGRVDTDFADKVDSAQDVAVQPDGKIVVVGFAAITYDAGQHPQDSDFALARYNPDGTLDTTFGGDGKVTTSFSTAEFSHDVGNAVVLQPDGKIVVAGAAQDFLASAFALARYHPDGSLDTGFDGDGMTTTDFTGFGAGATSMAIQGDGSIVAAGSAYNEGTADHPASSDFALARYTPDGSLDPTFGSAGTVKTAFDDPDANDSAAAVLVQPDGKIVAAGGALSHPAFPAEHTLSDLALVRYRGDGTLDPAFGVGGKTHTDVFNSASAMVRQSDGTFVVAAVDVSFQGIKFGLVRYTASGHRNGAVATDFGEVLQRVASLAVQTDGRIVAAGFTAECACHFEGVDFAVARFKPNGAWNYDPHHCINSSFVDLVYLLGVPDQVDCKGRIETGKLWRPMTFWIMNLAYDEAPPGYVPAAQTPLGDLISKVRTVKVIVDPGTAHPQTFVFRADQVINTDLTYDQISPDQDYPPYPMAISIPRIEALSVGTHTYEVRWVLTAKHCDGFSADEASSCLPAGETSFGIRTLNVIAP